MSKKIYVMVWTNEDGVSCVDGYWSRPLTDEEQHGFLKEHCPASYDPCGDGTRCDVTWEMVELKRAGKTVPLQARQWSGLTGH